MLALNISSTLTFHENILQYTVENVKFLKGSHGRAPLLVRQSGATPAQEARHNVLHPQDKRRQVPAPRQAGVHKLGRRRKIHKLYESCFRRKMQILGGIPQQEYLTIEMSFLIVCK